MSEQFRPRPARPQSFMAQLDQWTEANVINPLIYAKAEDEEETWKICAEQVKKAIRAKVLESYHNGQAAGPRKAEGRGL